MEPEGSLPHSQANSRFSQFFERAWKVDKTVQV